MDLISSLTLLALNLLMNGRSGKLLKPTGLYGPRVGVKTEGLGTKDALVFQVGLNCRDRKGILVLYSRGLIHVILHLLH